MPQIRPNKMTTPVNSDAYNLTADLATMADSANVTVNVNSSAERDALTKYNGLTVRRLDLPYNPTESWDGTNWNRSVPSADTGWLDAPLLNSFTPLADGSWGGAKYSARNGVVYLALVMNRTTAWTNGTTVCANIPAPYRPSIRIKGIDGWINSNGDVVVSTASGTYSGPGQVSLWITYPML